jgi:hypothetical protein
VALRSLAEDVPDLFAVFADAEVMRYPTLFEAGACRTRVRESE